MKLTSEAMAQFECSGGAAAYALAFSNDRQQLFLEEKEVRFVATSMIFQPCSLYYF